MRLNGWAQASYSVVPGFFIAGSALRFANASSPNYRRALYNVTGDEAALRVTAALAAMTATQVLAFFNATGEWLGGALPGGTSGVSATRDTIALPPGTACMGVTSQLAMPMVLEV